MREAEGCAVLKRRFEAAGLSITEGYSMAGLPGPLHLDGYDVERRVGYEYMTWEAADREEVTPEVIAVLETRMRAGELYVLLVDEEDAPDEASLERAADGFLANLRERGFIP